MKHLSTFLLTLCFSLTAFIAFSQVVNDECSGAITLTPSSSAACTTIPGTNALATPSTGLPPGCCSNIYDDVWYAFTATSVNHNVVIENIRLHSLPGQYSGVGGVEIYSGDCNNLQSLTGQNLGNSTYVSLTNLTIGDVYYIRVFGSSYSPSIDFDICISTPAPLANDECMNATPITPVSGLNCENNVVTTAGATQSLPGCNGNPVVNDVWYSFVATSQSHAMEINGAFESGFRYELMTGDCNNPVSIVCASPNVTYAPVFQNLTIGQTYYLRFSSVRFRQDGFYFCLKTLPPPPVNDDCANALPLTINAGLECTLNNPATTLGATNSIISCSGTPDHDIWYTFTATGEKILLEVTALQGDVLGSYNTYGLSLFSGSCGQLDSVTCTTIGYNPLILDNLTAGNTYYLRIFSTVNTGQTFNICARTLPPTPANADCANAEVIIPNTGNICTVVAHGSTISAPAASVTCNYGNTLWYKFTATSQAYFLSFDNIQTQLGYYPSLTFAFLQDGTCNFQTEILCRQVSSEITYLHRLTIGATYYIAVTSPPGTGVSFDLCLRAVPAPVNDACADAVTVPVNPGMDCTSQVSATLFGAGQDPQAECVGNTEVWFSFTATQSTQIVQLSNQDYTPLQPGAGNYAYSLYSGTCGGRTLLSCKTDHYGQLVVGELTPGETYYLSIAPPVNYTVNNTAFTFNMCVLTPPPPPSNDACVSAAVIPVNAGETCEQTVSGTTQNASPTPGLNQITINDVWYTFTATQSNQLITFNSVTNPVFGYNDNVTIAVYAGDCGSTTSITDPTPVGTGSTIMVTGLSAGTTYLVRIMPYYNPGVNFTICITSPPPPVNDECVNALPIPENENLMCTQSVYGTTFSATPSTPAYCGGVNARDIWYSFTATSSVYRLELYAGYQGNAGYELLQGDCNSLTSVRCSSPPINNPETFYDLVPGTTYYIRAFSTDNNPYTFSACLLKLPPPPVNDLCENAVDVTANTGVECNTVYHGTVLSARSESTPACSGPANDVWYKFTAGTDRYVLQLSNLQNLSYYSSYPLIEMLTGSCGNFTSVFCQNFDGQAREIPTTPGVTYWIRIANYYNSQDFSFDLCIKTLPPVPSNSTCFTAQELIPSGSLTCTQPVPGNTSGVTTNTTGSCTTGRSVWYTFVADSPIHFFELSNIVHVYGYSTTLFYELYQGNDCQHLAGLNCASLYSQPQILSNLTPGQRYYLRIVSQGEAGDNFDICITSVPQPSNDLCPGAVTLDVNPDTNCAGTTHGTTFGAGLSSGPLCLYGTGASDVWYQFTATQEVHTIALSNILQTPSSGGYAGYAGLEVMSGTCGNLQTIACRPYVFYNGQEAIGDLVPGQTYYVRISGTNTYIDFDICITTPPPGPANDACIHATDLLPAPGTECVQPVSGTTLNATPTWIGTSEISNDVWYSFTATHPTHTIVVSNVVNANYYYGQYCAVDVFQGPCGVSPALNTSSFYYGTSIMVTNLTPGQQYLIRVYSPGNPPVNFDICVTTQPIPDNDLCVNATPALLNTGYTCDIVNTGTTLGASGTQTGCEAPGSTDVWYQFTAPGTAMRVGLEITSYYNYGTNVLEVFRGDCSNLVSLFCGPLPNNGTTINGLIPGETIYVRVFSVANNFINFNLCLIPLPDPPANDDCANAVTLPVNAGLNCDNIVTGTTISAATSSYSCFGPGGADVWYRFTATSTSHIITLGEVQTYFPGNAFLGIEVYSGTCSGTLQSLSCSNANGGVSLQVSYLVPGDVYYVKVSSFNESAHEFSLCVKTLPPPPANISCSTAITVEPNTGLDCTITVSGQNASVPDVTPATCTGAGRAVWYQFTATSSYHIITLNNIVPIYGTLLPQLEIYEGADCNALNNVNCGYSAQGLELNNLIQGHLYYIRVSDANYGNSGFSFDLCIKTVPPPANDLCENASPLTVSPDLNCLAYVSGSTVAASPSALTSCFTTGADVWYSFTAAQASQILNINNVSYTPNYYGSYHIALYKGNCNAPELVQCWPELNYYNSLVLGDLEAGATYYIRMGAAYGYMNFDICITTPPPPPANDACVNATLLTASNGNVCANIVGGTLVNATPSAPSINYINLYSDVWYTFTAGNSNANINLTNIHQVNYNYPTYINLAVYEGSCGALNPIYVSYYYNNGTAYLTNLTPGQTYTVRVYYEESYSQTAFDICVTTPEQPVNDECTNALPLVVNTTYSCATLNTGSTVGATSSQQGCTVAATTDVWYQFVAPSTDMRIDISTPTYLSQYSYGYEILEGTCSALTTVYCGLGNQSNDVHGLTTGNTYYVRVYVVENTVIDFSLCIFPLPPAPVNDLCENAINVPVNPGLECINSVSGFTGGLTQASSGSCFYGTDMWYSFTALSNQHIISLDNIVQQYGYTDLRFEVYNSTDCNNPGYPLLCGYYGATLLNGLNPGSTYLVRVFGYMNSGASFDICIRSVLPQPNDECENAIVLIPSSGEDCTTIITGTNAGATPSNIGVGCGGPYNDVWYKFEATSIQHVLNMNNLSSGYSTYAIVDLYTGNCGALDYVSCNYANYAESHISLTNLSPGQTYYVRITSYSPTFFNICLGTLPIDISALNIINTNGNCNTGTQESVYIQVQNNSSSFIPPGAVQGQINVTGSNSGQYGPITNVSYIYPHSYTYIQISGVDLSNPGQTLISATINLPGDNNPVNDTVSLSLNILPLITIYPDNDNDGYGNAAYPISTCYLSYGYSTTPGDCDDNNPAVHPGATEICNNGIDDDCDGQIDETTLALSLSANVIPCGMTTTTLTASATGGALSYQYSLDSAAFQTANTWIVGPGTYLVIVLDANGCAVSKTITIAPPNNVVIAPVTITHVGCSGGNSGAIDITVTGGSGVYTYHWSNNKTTQDIQNLAANTYSVTVTDNMGCTAIGAYIVNPKLALTATSTNTACAGSNTGTATAVASGGTPAYTYKWSNNATTASISGLSSGTYTVTLTDAKGCTRKTSVTINTAPAINIGTSVTNAPCNALPGGAINITVNNGTAPFSYLWNDGATTEDRISVPGATYTVTVTDLNGCSATKVSTVTEPAPIYITFEKENISCNGGADGELSATVSGGTKYPANNPCNGERYCYQWSTGATSKKVTGLTAGTYTLTITDYNGCTKTSTVTLTQPPALVINNITTQQLQNGKYKVTIVASGGTSPYLYKRTPGTASFQTSNVFNNVPPGSYVFTVRDNNDCIATANAVLPVFFGGSQETEDRILINDVTDGLDIQVFPNPANEVVQIVTGTDLDHAQLQVFDLRGRQILRQEFSGTAATLRVDDWSSGLYFVEITVNGERYVRKLSVVKM